MSDIIRHRFVFHGRVQGVGFRAFCRDAASARSVRGWVRNLPDGCVEMEAEADPQTLDRLQAHIAAGHSWARVDRIDIMSVSPRRDDGENFDIIF